MPLVWASQSPLACMLVCYRPLALYFGILQARAGQSARSARCARGTISVVSAEARAPVSELRTAPPPRSPDSTSAARLLCSLRSAARRLPAVHERVTTHARERDALTLQRAQLAADDIAKMPTKSKAAKKKTVKFYVDCWQPVEDSVLDVATFEKFLRDTIKFDNKAGNLGDKVVLSTEKTKVVVQATDGVIAKRYLKYLTKKYLKKQQLRDYLHVVATAKNTYEMRYFSINSEGDDEA